MSKEDYTLRQAEGIAMGLATTADSDDDLLSAAVEVVRAIRHLRHVLSEANE